MFKVPKRKFVAMKTFKRICAGAALCLFISHLSMWLGWTSFDALLCQFVAAVAVWALFAMERDDREAAISKFQNGHVETVDGWDEETGLPIRERIAWRLGIIHAPPVIVEKPCKCCVCR